MQPQHHPQVDRGAHVERHAEASSTPEPNSIPCQLYESRLDILKFLCSLIRLAWWKQSTPASKEAETRWSLLWSYTENISDILGRWKKTINACRQHQQHLFQPHPESTAILHGKFLSYFMPSCRMHKARLPHCTEVIIWKAISSGLRSPGIFSEIYTWLQTRSHSASSSIMGLFEDILNLLCQMNMNKPIQ